MQRSVTSPQLHRAKDPPICGAAGLSATTGSAVQNEQLWRVRLSAGAARRSLLFLRNVQGHELPRRRLKERLEFR
jgi:hypothetical protein